MKAKLFVASLLALIASASAQASDVGVSISVGQPGFYGRLDIGDYPPPQLLYAQPVIIERPVRYVETAPIYLRVPPGHARDWRRHCHAYHACNQRVFFVQDRWYNNEYVPRYREHHGYGGHGGPGRYDHRPQRYEGPRDGRHDGRRDDHGPGPGREHGDHGDHGNRGERGDRGNGHDRDDHRGGHDR